MEEAQETQQEQTNAEFLKEKLKGLYEHIRTNLEPIVLQERIILLMKAEGIDLPSIWETNSERTKKLLAPPPPTGNLTTRNS